MYYACFVLLMLVPVAMVAVGLKWYLNPPAFRSGRLAYRTAVTERSADVWFFAHTHCGKLWVRYGVIFGVLTALAMIFLKKHYQNFWLWVLGAQMLILCITIFMVDLLCKNLYDEDGVHIETKAAPKEPSQIEG